MTRTTLAFTLLAAALAPALGVRSSLALDVDLAGVGTDAPNWLAELVERNDG